MDRVQGLPSPLRLGLPLYPSAERQGHGPDISQHSLQQITSNKAFRKAPLTTETERKRQGDGAAAEAANPIRSNQITEQGNRPGSGPVMIAKKKGSILHLTC